MLRPIRDLFTPADNKCIDCGKTVAIRDRQEVAWDEKDQCRRRCGACLEKRKAGD